MEIKPALTAEGWKFAMEYTVPAVLISGVEFYVSSEDTAFAAIAEINAALPDDDPRKITRADVTILEHAAIVMENEDVWGEPDTRAATAYRSLAAKLAALLPPE